ncbi:MAG: Mrp/NBP35 family ATP-binding protein [Planctomycetota bacterium]|nr:MAG: Mrp/NBP35 family ATP-binding protein [Planctomycetota bacterium]
MHHPSARSSSSSWTTPGPCSRPNASARPAAPRRRPPRSSPRAQSQPAAAPTQAPAQSPGHRPIGGLADTSGAEHGAGHSGSPSNPLDSIKHVIAVGAGKGGVGKSTIAVNLAVGLARQGHAVGLLDGDIYGPSLPTMLALDALEQTVVAGKLQPHAVHGIKAITIGKLVEPDKPLIWRGPMAHGAFKQLVEQASWGELDYLIIDLPPGTGDVCLTMAQTLTLTGAVLVCTPQKVAQDDAIRAARMFQQLKIDILGVVENMSFFIGDDGKEYDIFGRGGAEIMAQRMGLPFLGSIPINTALRANSDSGNPSDNFNPATAGGDALPQALQSLVTTLEGQVALASLRQGKSKPTLSIS